MLTSLWRSASGPRIRKAHRTEASLFVGALAAKALGRFGDYGRLLPDWMQRADISTYLAVLGSSPVAFTMLGAGLDDAGRAYADLLAIAVEPAEAGQGIGRQLLRHAVRVTRKHHRQLRLSVAETNTRARALFESEGFTYLPDELGTYCQGQVALRMGRPL